MKTGQKIQAPLRDKFVDCNQQQSRSNLAGCRISRWVTFCDILSKVVPFSQTRPSYLFLLKIKIVVYVLDSLDTIPKNSEADIGQCREKQIKECYNFKRSLRDSSVAMFFNRFFIAWEIK